MNYAEADALLQGRFRKRRMVGTFTYLERRDRAIAVSIDSSDKLVFHPDGRIDVAARWVDRLKRRPRINGFLPEPWLSRVFRKHTILYRAQDGPKKGWAVRGLVTVIPNGPIRIKGRRKKLGLRPFADVYEEAHKLDLARRRRRRKLDPLRERWRQRPRYWRYMIKRRGPFKGSVAAIRIERSKRKMERARESSRQRLYYWRRKVERREPSRLTVAAILKEYNVQIRAVKIQAYGFERYFLDAGAQTIDSSGEYALLGIGVGRSRARRQWGELVCLKMVCPSTGAAYISPVPPGTRTVDQALDWMFGVTDYRKNLVAES
jgi:hypothetical protein